MQTIGLHDCFEYRTLFLGLRLSPDGLPRDLQIALDI